MYCGAEIPVELRLSKEEKQDIAKKKIEIHNRQTSESQSSSNEPDDSIITSSIIIGSDFTSGGGDCG